MLSLEKHTDGNFVMTDLLRKDYFYKAHRKADNETSCLRLESHIQYSQ